MANALPFFLDVLVLAFIVLIMATQVIIPLWRDRPLFPILRDGPPWRRAREELKTANDQSDFIDLQKRIERVNQANARRRRNP